MKPAAFDYVRPASLADAIALLAQGDRDAQLMAGGQSLVAMMNLRVAAPDLVIDIGRLDELKAVSDAPDHVSFGACITHAAIEDGRVPDPSRGLMPRVAASLAYRAVRTRGTLGGSLALADPAADWPTVMAALDAELILRGPRGERTVAARISPPASTRRCARPTRSSPASASRSSPRRRAGAIPSSVARPASSPIRSRRWCVIPFATMRARCSAQSMGRRSCSSAPRPRSSPVMSALVGARSARTWPPTTSTISSRASTPRWRCAQSGRQRHEPDPIARERQADHRRRAGAPVACRFSARAAKPHRHASRLRARRVRGLYHPDRRRARACVPDLRGRLRRPRGAHHRRLRRRSRHDGVARRVPSASRAAVRLLHAGDADHRARHHPPQSRRLAAGHPQRARRQHLPLHRLYQHRRRHRRRGGGECAGK